MIFIFVVFKLAFAQVHEGQVIEVGTGLPVVATLQVQQSDFSCATDNVGTFVCDFSEIESGAVILLQAQKYQSRTLKKEEILASKVLWIRPELPIPEIVVESSEESFQPFRQNLDKEKVESTPGAYDDPIRLWYAVH